MSSTELDHKSGKYLGNVRSNDGGTEYNLYDNGNDPKENKFIDQRRCELGAVIYDKNHKGSKGPRKMKVIRDQVTIHRYYCQK